MRIGPDGAIELLCDRCGEITWLRIGLEFSDQTSEMRYSVADPEGVCLRCGAPISAEGVVDYVTTRGMLKAVARDATPTELVELAEALRRYTSSPEPVTAEGLADALEETPSEAARGLATWVRANGGWVPIAALIVAILALVNDLVGGAAAAPSNPGRGESYYSPEQVEHIVDSIIEQYDELRPHEPTPKLGRNEPCWCGSGTKYKKCHGRPESVIQNERRAQLR